MDTSWQIHRQWFKDIRKAFPTAKTDKTDSGNQKNDKTPQRNGLKLTQKETEKDDAYATINGTRKNLEIVKAIVSNEVNSKPEKQKNNTLSHTHHEPVRHEPVGNKMLASYSGVSYGDAFTTQPRSTKSSIRCSGTAGMDLSYVTERIIALWFPSAVSKQTYKQGQRHAAHMLRNKHGDNYMVFNLSEPKRILRSEHKHVKEMGWPAKLAPPLERICSICKEIESWLSGDKHRIAVLHARGSKDKLGVVVTSYMHYSNICGTADQALDRFAMRKYLEENIGPFHLPSNKRYVEYFAGLLSHNIKINTAPLYLTHVTVLGAPSFQYGGCRAFLKLYEGHTPIYTSGIYSVSNGIRQFTVNISTERRHGLQLRGDILVKCYHRGINGRETIFACQFHTCAVADYTLSFTRQELDNACTDARFPADGAVELHFSPGPEGRLTTTPAPTPAVPVTLADDPITRADSPLDAPDSEEDYNSEGKLQ
ncbi:tensin [Agrilus planipennis]|uniref:Tensin n=1 Tax=Agrilus planipennis TaxID=224129 RepID=A0A1W4XLC0_AGRPL|nr:tensin [Agrilus planipennis]